jgi:hypothetical protein
MEQQQTTDLTAKSSQAVATAAAVQTAKPKTKVRYIPVTEISKVLRKTQGRTCIAAQRLQMPESRLQSRIDRSKGLQEAQAEAVKFWEDLAEKTLVECVIRDKNIAGLTFFLKSRGRKFDLSPGEEAQTELPDVLDLLANVKRPHRPNNDQNNETRIETKTEQTIEP